MIYQAYQAYADYDIMATQVREWIQEAAFAVAGSHLVTHQDGTGRLQTVEREVQPRYWRLLQRFGELTGVPILINLPAFTHTFLLYPDDLLLTGKTIPWKITLDNLSAVNPVVVDASFSLVFSQGARPAEVLVAGGKKKKVAKAAAGEVPGITKASW